MTPKEIADKHFVKNGPGESGCVAHFLAVDCGAMGISALGVWL